MLPSYDSVANWNLSISDDRNDLVHRALLQFWRLSRAAHAATQREIAEWVLPLGGQVVLTGSRQPVQRCRPQLPAGEIHITGIDLSGPRHAAARNRRSSKDCPTCASFTFLARSGIPAAETKTSPAFQGARHPEQSREARPSVALQRAHHRSATEESRNCSGGPS